MHAAMRLLGRDSAIRNLHVGDAIVTEPVVPASVADDHPAYLNTAIIGETTRSPAVLMSRLLAVEAACGRRRRGAVDPRTLDLDLLVHEGVEVHRAGLEVPHPRLSGRRFVLEPLITLLAGLERSASHQPIRLVDALRNALKAAGVADSAFR